MVFIRELGKRHRNNLNSQSLSLFVTAEGPRSRGQGLGLGLYGARSNCLLPGALRLVHS